MVGLAEDGVQALERVAQHQPDLVLMDLKMPGMNGIDATRLHLSEGTVRNHVSAILAKLDVAGRPQAAVIAIRHGLSSG